MERSERVVTIMYNKQSLMERRERENKMFFSHRLNTVFL